MLNHPAHNSQPEHQPDRSPMQHDAQPATIRMPQRSAPQSDTVDTVDAAAATQLLDSLFDCTQKFHADLASALSEYGLSEIRYHVMQAIAESNAHGCSQRSLAAKFGQAESSISTLVQRMCQDGLLCQQQSPMDRRRRFLVLTETGRELIGGAHARYRQEVIALLQPLTIDQHAALQTILGKLNSGIRLARAA